MTVCDWVFLVVKLLPDVIKLAKFVAEYISKHKRRPNDQE